jgi:hypothetical protein
MGLCRRPEQIIDAAMWFFGASFKLLGARGLATEHLAGPAFRGSTCGTHPVVLRAGG